MLPIIKSATVPNNTNVIWIDLSTSPSVIKSFDNGKWLEISSSQAKKVLALNSSISAHISATDNPHSVTKSQVGLGNVTNDALVKRTEMGVANGVATLDSNGKVTNSLLPSYVDDVLEYTSKENFPTTGESGKIYVDVTTNLTYRWSGSAYVEISQSLALGETASTAFAGDRGKAVEEALTTKVDKVSGKGLSTNDFTTAYKNKIDTNANNISTVTTDLNNHINDTNVHIPSNGTKGLYLVSNGDGTSTWKTTSNDWALWYGVEWDTSTSTPNCTRIGNSLLHLSLPIQSKFKGCVVKDGKVNYYLYPYDWAYKEDGETPSVLDGTDGEVEVDTGGDFYIKSESEGYKRRVKISEYQIDETWIKVPRVFIDAYKTSVDSSTLTAHSVVNTSTNFRGGNNSTSYDKYLEGDDDTTADVFRTLLGKPRTSISRATMRKYAIAGGKYIMNYINYKYIMYWLPVIEYATFNLQLNFNATPDGNGFKQGGLSAGVTTMSSWVEYNGCNPLTPCGYTNSLGNYTGVVSMIIPSFTNSSDSTVNQQTISVPRYRGIENPFGDVWNNIDGIILVNDQTLLDSSGNCLYKNVYVYDNPEDNADTITDKARLLTLQEYNKGGYISEFNLGTEADIIPSGNTGGSTTYKCDYHYVGSRTDSSLRTLYLGGGANAGAYAGLGLFFSEHRVGTADAYIGFRCYQIFS